MRASGVILELHGVGVSFGATSLFSGVSFSVEEGQSVAIVGPSGSGKSSLLACVAGLARPSCGSIVVAGIEVTRATEGERARVRREMIGNVFQDPQLLEELTVRENVELPSRFRGCGEMRPVAGRSGRWRVSGSYSWLIAGFRSCRVARRSEWRSLALFRLAAGCCSPTSRQPRWIA